MESLSIQTNSAALRPVALQAELSGLLVDGRVLAGEVLTADGGRVLVSLGRHRVPADSEVPLQPGQRFLARVVPSAGGPVLEVLGSERAGESALLSALRNALGGSRPLGESFAHLLRALQAGAGAAAELGLVVDGALDARGLATALSRSGRAYEGWLLQLALSAGREATLTAALEDGLAAWLGKHAPGLSTVDGLLAELAPLLREAARELARNSNAREVRERWVALAREVAARAPEPARSALQRSLEHPQALARESALFARLAGGREHTTAEVLARLEADAKGRLLQLLGQVADGDARDAVRRLLQGLEADQLMNLARAEHGEGRETSLVAFDAGQWETLRFHERDPHGGEDESRPRAARLGFDVTLSSLGPVHVDLCAAPDGLFVRVEADEPETVRRIEAARSALEQELCCGDKPVHLVVAARAAAPEVATNGRDLLDGRSLMDVEG